MRKRVEVGLGLALLVSVAFAGSRQIDVQLRVPPELELTGTERIYVGPILLETREDAPSRRVDINAVREFERHVRKLIRRRTRLNLVAIDQEVSPPSTNPGELKDMNEFWAALGEESGADYIVSAFIDVEVLDREGYTTEKYVSPEDGQTYFRQVLVEETGFNYDILVQVYSGSGELVHEEQITDFKDRSQQKLDSFKDMFNDLFTLENRLLGIFVPRTVRAKRHLHSG
jgi:hypothetical protein